MKYQYTTTLTHDTKGRFIRRPLIELELLGRNSKSIKAFGLLDSGADTSLINIEYAKSLGIALDTRRTIKFMGISGNPILCHVADIDVRVKHFTKPLQISAAFIDSPSVGLLIGQEDFFEIFRIKFEKDHDVFELNLSIK